MFSPSQAPPPSIRSSRRRQRPLSSEHSVDLPNPKRTKRSAISEHTFLAPNGRPEMEETRSTKATALVKHEIIKEVIPSKEIVMRGKKSRSGDRSVKGDGTVVLVRRRSSYQAGLHTNVLPLL
jgi:nuclear pore complex protein Nup133